MRFRLSSKLIAGLSALIMLVLAGGVITILYTYRLHRVTSELLVKEIRNLQTAQELEVLLFRMRGLTLNYLLDGDAHRLEIFDGEKNRFQARLESASAAEQSDDERKILQALSSEFAAYANDHRMGLDLHRRGKLIEARAKLLYMSRAGFDELYASCQAYSKVSENSINAMQFQIDRANRFVRWIMYGLGAGGVLLGGLMSWVIARGLMKPIYELVLKVRGAAGDELIDHMNVRPSADLQDLDRHVHALIDRVNATTADLEKHRRLLLRSEKLAALGKVTAGVAHEIRNPLTAIKMLIYSLREELTTTDEKREDLAVIMKEIERLEKIVANFLEFARPPDPQFAPVEINAIVQETLALLAARLRQHHITVRENYRFVGGPLNADAGQLKQVIMNLAVNALEAMPQGGILKIETAHWADTAKRQAWAQIHVIDSGPGIPPEILENLFDPFVSGRKDGTGLGLSIAQQIITRHGGWIEASNNPSGGASFVVNLPLELAAKA